MIKLREILGKNRLSILFVGDIMNHLTKGISHDPFKNIKKQLKNFDICIGNLETTFSGKPYSGFPKFSSPDNFVKQIKEAGITHVVTANNHSADKNYNGLVRTIDTLDDSGIAHTGTFRNKVEKDKVYPLIIDKNNIKVALLNYTFGINGRKTPSPGIINIIDKPEIRKDIENAKKLANNVIVFFHWGEQYTDTPTKEQINLKNYCVEHGANIIIGSHPHVVQPIKWDRKNNEFSAYSLGNFVADQSANEDGINRGIVVKLVIEDDKIIKTKFAETEIKDYKVQIA